MSPRRGWPDGSDELSAELRRALDEASLRGPDDMMLRRGWSAVSLSLGGKRKARHEAGHAAGYDAASLGEPPALDMAALMAPSRARRGFWFAWGVATTAALAAVGAVWLWPRVSELAQSGSQHHRPVAKVEALAPGARHLTLEGGVEAVLGQSSVMRIEDGAPRVEGGEVRFSVPHRQPGHPFVVRADGYRVVVVGTKFGVDVAGRDGTVGADKLDGKTDKVAVDVDEGVVEVWETASGQRLARLTPGERWQSPELAPEPPQALPVEPEPEPTVSAAVPASPSPARAHHAGKPPGARTLALASPGDGASAHDREAPTAEAAAARAALASGDPNRALQLYKTLAQGTGPSAENASYEIGKVLNEKMGQPQSAVAAWRHYRSAYPDGLLRVEADVSIIETLGRIGESDEALSEANEFLRRHPDSERRAEIARLAGDLYRAHGDCRRALGAYQVALGVSRPRDAVEAAAFHRADYLVRLGDAGGPDAARAYLRAYPNGKFRSEATALASGSAPRP